MSRLSKFLLVLALIVFVLACSLISNPINDAKNTANTVQAFATDANALATQAAPFETLLANPSLIPDIGNFFDPQGTPVQVWNEIPVMPQATAGQEFNANTYSFKASATVQEATDFYDSQMISLGWSSTLSMPASTDGAILVFSKEGKVLTATITSVDANVVVVLTLA